MKVDELLNGLIERGYVRSGVYAMGVEKGYPVSLMTLSGSRLRASVGASLTGAQERRYIAKLMKEKGIRIIAGRNVVVHTIRISKDTQPCELKEALDRLVGALADAGIAPPDVCAVCGMGDTDAYMAWMIDGTQAQYNTVHQACAAAQWMDAMKKAESNEGSYLLGILGALIGCVVGAIPTLLLIWFADTISAVICALIPICSFYGYKLFRGRMNAVAVAAPIALTLLGAAFVVCAYDVMDSMVNYGYTMREAVEYMRIYLPIDQEYSSYFFTLGGQVLLYCALGVVISIGIITGTNKRKAKVMESLRGTLRVKQGVDRLSFGTDAAYEFGSGGSGGADGK